MRGFIGGVVVGGLLATAPSTGLAQVPAQEVRTGPEEGRGALPGELQLVGGIHAFTAGLSAGTEAGPYLGVAALWQPVFLLGTELRYEAGRLPFDDARLPRAAALWNHTVLGLVKLGLPVTEGLRPVLGTGVALSYLRPERGAEELYGRDIVVELPLVLGIEAHTGRLTGGVQVSYRSVIGESFDRTGLGSPSGGRVTAGLSLGVRL